MKNLVFWCLFASGLTKQIDFYTKIKTKMGFKGTVNSSEHVPNQ